MASTGSSFERIDEIISVPGGSTVAG